MHEASPTPKIADHDTSKEFNQSMNRAGEYERGGPYMRKTCDRSPLSIVAAVGELIAAFPSPKLEEAYRVEVTLLPDTVVVEV